MPIDTQPQETLAAVPTMQEKWDQIHGRSVVKADAWPQVLVENVHLLPTHGRALDVAWDISPVAIAKLRGFVAQHGLAITAEVVDVTGVQLPAQAFDVIHVSRF